MKEKISVKLKASSIPGTGAVRIVMEQTLDLMKTQAGLVAAPLQIALATPPAVAACKAGESDAVMTVLKQAIDTSFTKICGEAAAKAIKEEAAIVNAVSAPVVPQPIPQPQMMQQQPMMQPQMMQQQPQMMQQPMMQQPMMMPQQPMMQPQMMQQPMMQQPMMQQPMMQPQIMPQQPMMQPQMMPQQPMMQQPMMQPQIMPQQPMMQPQMMMQPMPTAAAAGGKRRRYRRKTRKSRKSRKARKSRRTNLKA